MNEEKANEPLEAIDKELPEKHRQRQIRSFVMRTGRMTPSQKKAYDEHFAKYGLSIAQGPVNQQAIFQREKALVLEIGFGMGDSLIEMAEAAPEQDFIGIEVHTPGVGRLMHRIEEQGLSNLRAYSEDAVEVIEHCITDNSLTKVQIFFPDPWHKKKHNKRRIIQPAFVQKLRSKLKTGGMLHLATDWQNYAEHMMEVMTAAEGFSNQLGEGCYSPRPEFRPVTKFEKRGQRLGHGVWDLLFIKQS
jgi:tRNA (guanine-N7-)-methyltransferase